ncbi:amidohydrolase [Sporosarcina pasteurii]|uniref:Aminobenzoyl-glutamate utilization protein B n=1 Tax=Sporosarcina pasteurii TaxID=1474 RepID=A0A380C297_SPOPA|nr:amidohydrolase [Sporosarcina pasteurii]MDS9471479.1 amidohydrolase [Sporosarcina pasteurii]QBQ04900.1 amidohydrolase [Sporosarcina pasteurii]SUJ10498.1 Aminobenzoyl-glutamate utilization protein B [Sporosarcina pasteurii]
MHTFIKEYIENKKDYFEQVSEYIFNHPETRFEEYESAHFLMTECERQGFTVERNIANIPTAFKATYGAGKPVISFLGEFDALPGLNQKPCATQQEQIEGMSDIGHGCGHNLLGTGAFAAACAAKAYLEENDLSGTVIFYGCPGEEGGSGKTFMVRENAFEGVDAALTWHPSPANAIMSLPTLANYQVSFHFEGVAAHAANSPHLGRSALDAVELMNVGVNYLREHIIQDARVHYAVTNTGGFSPAVVQPNAEVLYLIRAPKIDQVEGIYQRICKIAEGAALMTETKVTVEFHKACSNYVPNRSLEALLHKSFKTIGADEPTYEEKAYAKQIWDTFTQDEQDFYIDLMRGFGYIGDGSEFEGKHLSDSISDYKESEEIFFGSTDVADVSWVVPTAQLTAATSTLATPLHTWQMTAQGLSSFAHKGMLRAAAAMALTGINLLTSKEELKKIQDEFFQFQAKHPYRSPIGKDIRPTTLNGKKI